VTCLCDTATYYDMCESFSSGQMCSLGGFLSIINQPATYAARDDGRSGTIPDAWVYEVNRAGKADRPNGEVALSENSGCLGKDRLGHARGARPPLSRRTPPSPFFFLAHAPAPQPRKKRRGGENERETGLY